jgi:imidazole glycerol-phosphate synthase subunit HisH
MIVIIDYGMGNLGSILNMLKKIGAPAKVSAEVQEIQAADKLILPGVGAFDAGMARLEELNLVNVLNDKVFNHKTPTLGVCLGMQLLTRRSAEGARPGLGWIDGETIRFRFTDPAQSKLKIPHMGWNTVKVQREGALFKGLNDEARFYFVHSYHVVCHNPADILTTTDYGYDFVSAVQREHIMGAQFHPEKSHKFGLKLLKNFVELA